MGERLAFTFALTGRREWGLVPRALPWAGDLLGFQPAHGRRQGFFRTIFIYLIFLNFERPTFHELPAFPFDHSVEPVVRSQDFFIGEILERLGNFLFREAV